jgi:hypothetical protein
VVTLSKERWTDASTFEFPERSVIRDEITVPSRAMVMLTKAMPLSISGSSGATQADS